MPLRLRVLFLMHGACCPPSIDGHRAAAGLRFPQPLLLAAKGPFLRSNVRDTIEFWA